MPRLATLAMISIIAAMASGCFFLQPGYPHQFGSLSSGDRLGTRSPSYCAVRPDEFTSWTDHFDAPPQCPSEGWIRQVVRDIHELDSCFDGPQGAEARLVLAINQHGSITNVSIEQPTSQLVSACVEQRLFRWEFAAAPRSGELLVVYRPPRAAT